MRLTPLLALLIAAPLAAQPATGYDRLADDLRQSAADGVTVARFEQVWDEAVADGRYARADSIAVLARVDAEAATGVAYDSLAFPTPADALALRFLRGDPAALDWIANDGRWWGGFLTWDGEAVLTYQMGREAWLVWPREATREAIARDSARAVDLLLSAGASGADVGAARLALARLGAEVEWGASRVQVEDQDDLNRAVDRFLEEHPRSRYEAFMRREIRRRYTEVASASLYFDLGGAGAEGSLGEGTDLSIAIGAGAGVRLPRWHAGLTIRGGQLPFHQTAFSPRGTIEDGESLSALLFGLEAGPRLTLGPLDALPYVAGGYLLQTMAAPSEDQPVYSTYEPPDRLSWGYGLALEVDLGSTPGEFTGRAIRLGVHRLHPQLSGAFADDFSGAMTTVTVGFSSSLFAEERVD